MESYIYEIRIDTVVRGLGPSRGDKNDIEQCKKWKKFKNGYENANIKPIILSKLKS